MRWCLRPGAAARGTAGALALAAALIVSPPLPGARWSCQSAAAAAAAAGEEASSLLTVAGLEHDCRVARGSAAALSPADAMRAVRCVAYLGGLADMLNLSCLLARQGIIGGRLPVAATAGVRPPDLVEAFLGWSERHPEERDSHQSLAGLAFVESFPCR